MKPLRDIETTIFNKINPAVSFSVSRYVFSIGIFVAIVVFGVISLTSLGVSQTPSVDMPVCFVSTSFSGGTPSVVDRKITQIIESAVSGISGITDISSVSQSGTSTVIINFQSGIDKYAATNQVSSAISARLSDLPSGAGTPTVKALDPNSQAVIQVGVSGGDADLADVSDYVENDFIPILQRVSGVGDISTDGGPSRGFQVLLDPNKLARYDLTPQDVESAVGNSVVNTSIGSITHQKSSLSFSTYEQPTDTSSISSIIVDASRQVTVGDVASIRISSSTTDYARVNGKPVVLVNVRKTTDANTVAVVNGVRRAVARASFPAGYSAVVGNDTSSAITASVNNTYKELIIVSIVVAVIVMMFLGKLNTAIAVILAIPIALSASPILYRFCGFTLNLVSLLALINAIGIVVDDSIVVAENVERYLAMGFSHKEAVLKGASEVFSAVVAATFSLLSVLIPVSFMGGMIGGYIRQFSLGLAAAVAFSLLEALLFLTVRLAYTKNTTPFAWPDFLDSFGRIGESMKWGLTRLKHPLYIILGLAVLGLLAYMKMYVYMPVMVAYPVVLGAAYYLGRILLTFLQSLTTTLHEWTEASIGFVRDAYVRSLKRLLPHSVLILVTAAAFLVFTIAVVSTRVHFSFMPQTDSGRISATLELPIATPIEVTNAVTNRLEKYLSSRPDVQTVQTVVASQSMLGGSNESRRASLDVTLIPASKRGNLFDVVTEIKQKMDALITDYPSATLEVTASGNFSGNAALAMDITSSDFDLLRGKDSQILQVLRKNPRVLSATSSLSDATLEMVFTSNAASLEGTGISPGDVSKTLQIAASGSTAATVQRGGTSYDIVVQVDPAYLSDQQSLLNLPIHSSLLGSNLQIGQLGSFGLKQAPNTIKRYNRIYYVEYTIALARGSMTFLQVQDEFALQLREKGILTGDMAVSSGSSTGATALSSQMASTAPQTFLLALFLAYLVMGAQFNSWRYPLYLLLPVPLALVGALWMVVFKGGNLDIFGLMGMLMLIGLSAKNAILYLDFVTERIGKMPLEDALLESGNLRFRPIVMTTLTVLVTSFPLIFGKGEGSEFGQGLGVVTFGGIILSAILTFYVVPAAFYLFERKRIQRENPVNNGNVGNQPPEAAG